MMGMTLIPNLDVARKAIDVYRDTARSHGRETGPDDVLTGHHTSIAATDEEAREHMRSALSYFHKVLMLNFLMLGL